MTYLNVRVTRIWDPDWYPGFAECALVDASGAEHRFQDKIPVFSARTLQVSVRYFCMPAVGANTKSQCRRKLRRYSGITRSIFKIPFV